MPEENPPMFKGALEPDEKLTGAPGPGFGARGSEDPSSRKSVPDELPRTPAELGAVAVVVAPRATPCDTGEVTSAYIAADLSAVGGA